MRSQLAQLAKIGWLKKRFFDLPVTDLSADHVKQIALKLVGLTMSDDEAEGVLYFLQSEGLDAQTMVTDYVINHYEAGTFDRFLPTKPVITRCAEGCGRFFTIPDVRDPNAYVTCPFPECGIITTVASHGHAVNN